MDRPGTFIMSLDCEGKWGVADHLDASHDILTDESLAEANEKILQILDRYDMGATFAFVMASTLTQEERRHFDRELTRRADDDDDWLHPYWTAQDSGRTQGWYQPDAFELVRKSPRQEIACHGFCHRPLGAGTSEKAANLELAAAVEASRLKGVRLSTFIYPRNQVGNVEALKRHGFIGYRTGIRRWPGLVGRAVSLASEFDIWTKPQQAERSVDAVVAIPPGYFFNYRSGARRFIPADVTVARWKALLRRSARDGGVVHLWSHPENFVTVPETADALDRVLAAVAEARDRGELRVETQEQYCKRQLASV